MGAGTLGRGGQGVSFTPGGRGAPAPGYNKMTSGPKGAGLGLNPEFDSFNLLVRLVDINRFAKDHNTLLVYD